MCWQESTGDCAAGMYGLCLLGPEGGMPEAQLCTLPADATRPRAHALNDAIQPNDPAGVSDLTTSCIGHFTLCLCVGATCLSKHHGPNHNIQLLVLLTYRQWFHSLPAPVSSSHVSSSASVPAASRLGLRSLLNQRIVSLEKRNAL